MNNITKPNRYISIFKPFPVGEVYEHEPKIVSLSRFNLKKFLLHYRCLTAIKTQGKEINEKILSIFTNNRVCLGKRSIINRSKNPHLQRITALTSRSKPIEFSFLGFPYKMPNPLKTNRVLPDLGEAGMFLRFYELNKAIKKIYQPGAVFNIFLEGIAFKTQDGVSEKDISKYNQALRRMLDVLGWKDFIKLIDLHRTHTQHLPDFEQLYKKILKQMAREYQHGNQGIKDIVSKVWPVNFTSYNSLGYKNKDLLQVYNLSKKESQLTLKQKAIYKRLSLKAIKSSLEYLAFHKTRQELKAMEVIAPGMLRLTVSPKENSLGIHTINKNTKLLPYHGVTVINKSGIYIEYLINVKKEPGFFAYYINGEKQAFFYSKLNPDKNYPRI